MENVHQDNNSVAKVAYGCPKTAIRRKIGSNGDDIN